MVKTKRGLIAALIAVIWAVTAVLFLIPNVSATASPDGLEVTGGKRDTDYTYTGGVLTVETSTPITIKNVDPNKFTRDTIVVKKDVSANITLDGVTIFSDVNACAFEIEDGSKGNVTITLADGSDNTLQSDAYYAGLQKNGSGDGIGNLTIQGGTLGTGKLTASTSFGAGIGGGDNADGSNITINGGTVTAESFVSGAGIGGGYNGSGTDITINKGTVIAGSYQGAGIGGGKNGSSTDITISGGTVTATSTNGGAGIGGGNGGSGTDITISGGTVTAASAKGGAGIGGGIGGNGSNIIISGGSVKATADADANVIGGGKGGSGAVTPTLDDKSTPVYLFKINNPNDENVYIDGKLYSPKNHKAADSSDGNLYAYLTFENHIIKVGSKEIKYVFDSNTNSLIQLGSDFTISGENLVYGTDYTYPADSHVLTVLSDKEVTISGTAITDTIVVKQNVSANITLDGVNIDVSGTEYACAFKIEGNSTGNVKITLADGSTNILKSGEYCAGLQKNGTFGSLEIKGTGLLDAKGGENGAGIGGGSGGSGTDITISGGTVTAAGGEWGAGIGGGAYASGTNISISGGTVTTTGGKRGAGIGGGNNGSGTDITISGGTVTAAGGEWGAGIGGGAYGSGTDITISGGSVKATAGSEANAIGGGYNGNGAVTPTLEDKTTPVYLVIIDNPNDEDVYLDGKLYLPKNHRAADSSDGKLYAYLTGKDHIIKVGSTEAKRFFDTNAECFEKYSDGLTITGDNLVYGTDYTYPENSTVLTVLSDKEVTISGTTATDTIAVKQNISANITLDGVNIDVSGKYYACALQIEDDSTGNVTITLADGSNNILKSGYCCAGLQKNGTFGSLEIKGTGSLEATGGMLGAGIGGGKGGSGSNITISGGTVTANGSENGAGIGGGEGGSGSNISISGGTVTANGRRYAAGIGGGEGGSGTNISISGGTVTANGGYCAAGIGGGEGGSGSNISIKDGIVIANGDSSYGAGIGGGKSGDGTDITISGGTVTANGGYWGVGIGGGSRGSGSNITISGGSVKATAGTTPNSIGGGNNSYGSVIPTNGTENVYYLVLDNPGGKAITINGKAYPTSHGDEKKIYVYLPPKTAAEPNTVKIGESTALYYCDTANKKWYGITDIPDADDTEFIYNGKEQTYTIPENPLYTITGNKQKNAGDHTVTVALKDNAAWSDGTTDDKTFEFIIAKVIPTVTVTANPTSDIAGKTIAVTASAINPNNDTLDDIPDITFTYKVGDGDEISFTDSFVIPEDTAIGTVITVKAKTAEDGNYKSGEAETKVNVSDCAHNDVNAKWQSDSTGHWHICNYCSEKVDFAAHTEDSGTVTTEPTETTEGVRTFKCTVCGYVIRTEAVPTLNHTHVVSEEYSKDGTGHWKTCSGCSEKVDFAAHTFGQWKITVPATETSEGKKVRICTVCGYTEEKVIKYTAALKAAEEAEKALEDITAGNDTTAEDIINSITGAIGDDVTAKVTEIKKVPATVDSEGSVTVVITITDSDGNTETAEKTFVIGKLPKNDKAVYHPVSISGNVTADKSSAKAGETVNVSTAFGYDIIVTSNGRQIARITEKGSFVMPNGSVHITVVQNDTLAVMSNAWNHSYVYSYDSDMNRIRISSDSKRGTVTIKLGSEYAGREFIIYKGRNSTKVKVTEGVLDENGTYSFKSDDGRNYTLVIK